MNQYESITYSQGNYCCLSRKTSPESLRAGLGYVQAVWVFEDLVAYFLLASRSALKQPILP